MEGGKNRCGAPSHSHSLSLSLSLCRWNMSRCTYRKYETSHTHQLQTRGPPFSEWIISRPELSHPDDSSPFSCTHAVRGAWAYRIDGSSLAGSLKAKWRPFDGVLWRKQAGNVCVCMNHGKSGVAAHEFWVQTQSKSKISPQKKTKQNGPLLIPFLLMYQCTFCFLQKQLVQKHKKKKSTQKSTYSFCLTRTEPLLKMAFEKQEKTHLKQKCGKLPQSINTASLCSLFGGWRVKPPPSPSKTNWMFLPSWKEKHSWLCWQSV